MPGRAPAVLAVTLVSCGSQIVSTARSMDGGGAADATTPSQIAADGSDVAIEAPSSEDVTPPPVPAACDAGFFVEVHDDAGVQTFGSGCSDSGPDVPTIMFNHLCGEDCLCTFLTACNGSGSLVMSTLCGTCVRAECSVHVTYVAADGGQVQGNGALQFSSFPPAPGPVAGSFSGAFTVSDDAGHSTAGDPAWASFCVYQQ